MHDLIGPPRAFNLPQALCPICNEPPIRGTRRPDGDDPLVQVADFSCAGHHIWSVKWAEVA